ncbi:MAG: copper resistance protein B [Pseudomonadota bacterium]
MKHVIVLTALTIFEASGGEFDSNSQARQALRASHGGQSFGYISGERLEYQALERSPQAIWEAQAWWGSDDHKLWFKTEGEFDTHADQFEEMEYQLLYSRATLPFWDLQAGFRQDFSPDTTRSYATIGVMGLAPYWFEVDAALFVSHKGKVSARLELEYDLRVTQRAILQPRVELNGAFADDAGLEQGSGLTHADVGIRLRYEFTRQFAPYFGVEWSTHVGETADRKQLSGEDTAATMLVAGIRLWF